MRTRGTRRVFCLPKARKFVIPNSSRPMTFIDFFCDEVIFAEILENNGKTQTLKKKKESSVQPLRIYHLTMVIFCYLSL